MKSLVIIPARGGSKGIPGKNIAPLAGKPLIQWTIEAAKHLTFEKDIYVSSDCNKIISFAESQGVNAIKRPHNLARDETPTEPVIAHLLALLGEKKAEYPFLILLQPTSPLRNSDHINQALTQFLDSGADALISVTKPEKHPLKAFLIDTNGHMQGILNNEYPFMPRQALPQTAIPNGAIYCVKTQLYLQNHHLFQVKTIPFYMEAKYSIDIDSPEDLQYANQILLSQHPYVIGK